MLPVFVYTVTQQINWGPSENRLQETACDRERPQQETRDHQSKRGVVVSGVRHMNEVNARRARLVLGWVTVFGRVYHLGM